MKRVCTAVIVIAFCLVISVSAFDDSDQLDNDKYFVTTELGTKTSTQTPKRRTIISQETYEESFGEELQVADGTISDTELPERPAAQPESEKLVESPENNEAVADYQGEYIEFMGFNDQEITKDMSLLILANVSSNVCNMSFEIYDKEQLLTKVDPIVPGSSTTVNLYNLLYDETGDKTQTFDVTIKSQAVTADGTCLNQVQQTIKVKIEAKEDSASAETDIHTNQTTGAIYHTAVFYKVDNSTFSVIIPATIDVYAGTQGTQFNIGFRTSNLTEKDTLMLIGGDVINNDKNYTLAHNEPDNSIIQALDWEVLTGSCSELNAQHTADTSEAMIHWIGPAYCMLSKGSILKDNVYGVTTFELKHVREA